jgi:hypothetical protein
VRPLPVQDPPAQDGKRQDDWRAHQALKAGKLLQAPDGPIATHIHTFSSSSFPTTRLYLSCREQI